jgi:hypothetical protein
LFCELDEEEPELVDEDEEGLELCELVDEDVACSICCGVIG